jgi:hypothetical protein
VGESAKLISHFRSLGVGARGGVAHDAPQNALYGFDIILPVKSLRLLMFQASAGSQHVRARVARVACGVAPVHHERGPPVTCNAAVTCNGSLFAGNAAVTCNAWGRSHVSESLEAPEPEGVRCDGKIWPFDLVQGRARWQMKPQWHSGSRRDPAGVRASSTPLRLNNRFPCRVASHADYGGHCDVAYEKPHALGWAD